MHQNGFELVASWMFSFATSHGKSLCDGVGGTVKCAVTKESLINRSTNYFMRGYVCFAIDSLAVSHVFSLPQRE